MGIISATIPNTTVDFLWDEVASDDKSLKKSSDVIQYIKPFLDAGYLVILKLEKTYTTHGNHFLVVNGYRRAWGLVGSPDINELYVRDPNMGNIFTTLNYLAQDSNPKKDGNGVYVGYAVVKIYAYMKKV